MGFWHTGYAEFHEEVGLEGINVGPPPEPRYPCNQCDAVFDSLADLRQHRFQQHLKPQPSLLVHGIEVGATPTVITATLTPSDVVLESANSAIVNGKTVGEEDLGQVLSEFENEVVHVHFPTDPGRSPRILDFQIATHDDILGVEKCFFTIAEQGRLDRRTIDEFIHLTKKPYPTAAVYFDGICNYLYGVLAKERSSTGDIPYERYREKFNMSLDSLKSIDRALAHQICNLINFNFNRLVDVDRRNPKTRVGVATSHLLALGQGNLEAPIDAVSPRRSFDRALTDADTELIIEWACRDLSSLTSVTADIKDFSDKDTAELDKSKSHVLLAAARLAQSDLNGALNCKAELHHLDSPQFPTQGLLDLIGSRK